MTVCLCGRGADLDKVNKYLSFSPFDIILISEYVDDSTIIIYLTDFCSIDLHNIIFYT